GGGADRIFGSERDDVIEAGHGDAIIDGKGGTNVVTLHGNHGDYTVTDTGQGYTVTDHLAGRDGTLTLKNIQKLNFADISVVDLTLPNAMPVSDSLRTDQAGLPFDHTRPHLIAASVLLANDQRLNSQGAWKIASVDDAVGGNVALTAGGDVQFTPDPSYSGVMSFKYSVIDAQGRPAATVVNLNNGQTAPMRAVVTLTTPDVPTDPLAAQQWYLSDANVIPVWHDYTGKGIRIGQFEPGGEFATAPQILDVNHPDLASNIDPVWQTTQQSAKTMPQSVSNHATMVAGVMVAAKNGQGGVGVAYDAKVGGHYLANSGADLTALGKMVGYDIANHSWGFKNDFALSNLQRGRINTESALLGTAQYAAENGRSGLGTIMVAAGGNAREQGGSAQGSLIGNSRFATQVGAINAQGDLSTLQSASVPFSNPGASLLVSAPGSSIVSTSRMLETDRGSTFGNRYDDMQGTSFAAPIVSGIVALMLEANPNLGYRDVQAILALSARKVTDASTQWDVNGAHNWNGGGMHVSHDYGLGAVDARAAVRFAESWMTQSTGANIGVQSASSNALGQSVAAGTTFNSSLTMRDGVRVEHAEIDIDANVGRLGDLIVKLVSPSGTQSILLNRTGKIPAGATGASDADTGSTRSGEFNYTFMSTRHWGERSGGDWKLEVTHAATGEPVTLNNWSLRVYGNTNPDATGYAYFYTDEFAGQAAADPSRAMFDGLADHLPVVSKTIHAAAVSRDTQIDLTTGVASIGGTPLKITHAGAIRNIVTGDGNDVLRASDHQNALLDGGRGTNTLRGGLAGTDCFVVHRRAGGLDTIENFDAPRGELIDLVGFKGKSFKDLEIKQIGLDLAIDLGDSQRVVLKNQNTAALADRHFVFQDTFAVPEAHHRRAAQPAQAETADGMETVVLTGGGGGVGLVGSKVTLTGKVYSHGSGDSDRFVIRHQPDAAHYRNTLRGFRHGVDKIDLSQTGIASFGDLAISKVERMKINGIASIHGVSVAMRAPGVEGEPVELLYLDAMEMAQVTESDFIFAKPGAAPVITTDPVSNPPGTEFVPHPAPSFSTNAAQRIQAVLDKLRPVGPLAVPTVVPDVRPEPVHAPDLIASPAHHRSARALSSDLVHDAPGPIDVPRGYTVDRLIQDKAAFASRPAGAAVFIPPQSHAAQPTLVANLR
ncbi:MAG TPA: S8 family serine peptidase, partial [Pararobbsia sp.]|nr:S8 family serine peptidase [Pararobbsia sp.]